jgi:hypothetical protein
VRAAFTNEEKAVPAPVAALAGSLMRMPYMRWARHTTREVLESFTGNRGLAGAAGHAEA